VDENKLNKKMKQGGNVAKNENFSCLIVITRSGFGGGGERATSTSGGG